MEKIFKIENYFVNFKSQNQMLFVNLNTVRNSAIIVTPQIIEICKLNFKRIDYHL
ncbi:MAG: hypothetical protein DAHOPDDO_01602 [Ignavibacteriaceae bacterium]|jgi:hypothetical protein|nr:hypothetical protein [Ignavibacteriaceae bacterium]